MARGGYPDHGDGRYAMKLGYKQWVEFNNAIRVHQNFVEALPMVVFMLFVGGLVLPKFALATGIINGTCRIIYATMYVKGGSDSRVIGAVAGSLPLYLLGIANFVALIVVAAGG